MKKIYCLLTVLLVLVFSLSALRLANAGDEPSDDIKNAAKEGVNELLKDKRNGGLHRLGFNSQSEIDDADLGAGFQIYTIRPEKLLNETTSLDLHSLLVPTNQWQFMVVSGIKSYALLTVDLFDGKWSPVSIGSSDLAKELSDILKAWPASSGYKYRLIRVYQANSNFIELSQTGKVLGIIPLASFLAATSDVATNAFDPIGLRDPKEVLPSLRPIIKRNLEKNR